MLTWLYLLWEVLGAAPVLAAPTLTPSNQLKSMFKLGAPDLIHHYPPFVLRINYLTDLTLKASLIKGLFIFFF